ncbi:hypothetical protein [Holospora curviuscula]|uniref:hypothetical protein n=1 Tax=Holospora curviuscula TaxID=1082868 RepID=UPI003C6BFB4A
MLNRALFHNAYKTKALIEFVDFGRIFLPPYSLDLNLIKKFRATMKRWINRNITQCTE